MSQKIIVYTQQEWNLTSRVLYVNPQGWQVEVTAIPE